MAWDLSQVNDLYAEMISVAQRLAIFNAIVQHDPLTAPQSLPALAVWAASIAPARGRSGQASTSVRVEFGARIYRSQLSKPEEAMDPQLISLTSQLFGAWSGEFTLDGEVMALDLLGAWGTPLSGTAGWVTHDGKPFRVMEIVAPAVIDDVWVQEA